MNSAMRNRLEMLRETGKWAHGLAIVSLISLLIFPFFAFSRGHLWIFALVSWGLAAILTFVEFPTMTDCIPRLQISMRLMGLLNRRWTRTTIYSLSAVTVWCSLFFGPSLLIVPAVALTGTAGCYALMSRSASITETQSDMINGLSNNNTSGNLNNTTVTIQELEEEPRKPERQLVDVVQTPNGDPLLLVAAAPSVPSTTLQLPPVKSNHRQTEPVMV